GCSCWRQVHRHDSTSSGDQDWQESVGGGSRPRGQIPCPGSPRLHSFGLSPVPLFRRVLSPSFQERLRCTRPVFFLRASLSSSRWRHTLPPPGHACRRHSDSWSLGLHQVRSSLHPVRPRRPSYDGSAGQCTSPSRAACLRTRFSFSRLRVSRSAGWIDFCVCSLCSSLRLSIVHLISICKPTDSLKPCENDWCGSTGFLVRRLRIDLRHHSQRSPLTAAFFGFSSAIFIFGLISHVDPRQHMARHFMPRQP